MTANGKDKMEVYENYPLNNILVRWFFALTEMGIASYFVFNFGFQSGLIFLIYGFVGIFVLLPLARCIRCYYYGKVCNFGLGKWVAVFFPEAGEKKFASAYGFTVFLWPLRIIPLGLGIIPIIGVIRFGLTIPSGDPVEMLETIAQSLRIIPHGLFVIYLAVIFLHRKYYRSRSCTRCHHKTDCPVYDKNILRGTLGKSGSVLDTLK
jgi:hypothetical protein